MTNAQPTAFEWLTLSQAAALANVSRSTLNRWAITGVLPPSATLPVGRTRVRYARSWFQSRPTAPAEWARP